jgi:hypothetical protein
MVEARRELRRRSQLEMIQCLVPKLELKLESELEQGLEHSCPEGRSTAAGLTGVSKKLLNHPKHGKHALLHLLYLCILPLSDSVK